MQEKKKKLHFKKSILLLSKRHGHRSRSEIISQILQAAIGGSASNTKIMYMACLNYNQLKESLTILIENDLLIYDGDTQTFKTTEKGLTFLQAYSQIDQMLKEHAI